MTTSQTVPIYTIGYGSRSAEEMLELLHRLGIQYLVDVRSQPYSRYKPEFSREALEAALAGPGIRYLFLGEQLGGRPDDPTCYVDGKVDYDRCREKTWYREGISRIQRAWEQQLPVALMCSEGKPEHCHRSKLLGATLEEIGVSVRHIDERGELRTQAEVIARLSDGQLSFFGSDFQSFRSRKRYHQEGNDDDEA